MRRRSVFLSLGVILLGAVVILVWQNNYQNNFSKMGISILSPAFSRNQNIPEKYTCDAENLSPPLEISGVSEAVKSIAIIMDDPDAPSGTWVHWLLWNIPPDTRLIPEGEEPPVSVGIGSGGVEGYQGPCPPSGTHRYFFKVYALDAVLGLPEGAGKSDLLAAMENHIIEQAELIGTYKKAGNP